MAENDLKQEKIIRAMLDGSRSDAEICSLTGISTRTIGRIKTQESFKKRLREVKAELVEGAVLRLTSFARGAVETLHEISLNEMNGPSARVAAAGRLAAMALEAGQLSELESKVMELERKAERANWSSDETQGTEKND